MSKRNELFERKRQAMELMEDGVPWLEANRQSGLDYCKSGIQQLYRQWREGGKEALVDHRGGSQAKKATSEVREWMIERCDEDVEVRANQLTSEIKAEFGVGLHPDYVGLLRHQLGLPVPRPGRPRKRQEVEAAPEKTEEDFSPKRGRGNDSSL